MATPKENSLPSTQEIPNLPVTDLKTDASPESQVSPELQELERRLNNNMLQNIAISIDAALKPIKDIIDKILTSSDLIIIQEEKIKSPMAENVKLRDELDTAKSDISGFKSQLTDLENKALECNLIFGGIEESLNETDDCLKEKIY